MQLLSSRSIASVLFTMLAAVTIAAAQDDSFLYVNDDVPFTNTVSAFRIPPGGALQPLTGSPFNTGGSGRGGAPTGTDKIAIVGRFLYVSNAGNSTVSGFTISARTGNLTPISGSPFSTFSGFTGLTSIALSATPNGAFLMAGNGSARNITVFAIDSRTGSLSRISGSPFPAGGDVFAMKVIPGGMFLAVVPYFPIAGVGMFSIGSNGVLTPVAGSPFSVPAPLAIDSNCAGNLLYTGINASGVVAVIVYTIEANGSLTQLGAVSVPGGSQSGAIALDSKQQSLYVTNQLSDSITAFSGAASGNLTLVPGTPFTLLGNGTPAGMAFTKDGKSVFVGNTNKLISALQIGPTGALASIAGSPFLSSNPAAVVQSLAVFPTHKPCGDLPER